MFRSPASPASGCLCPGTDALLQSSHGLFRRDGSLADAYRQCTFQRRAFWKIIRGRRCRFERARFHRLVSSRYQPLHGESGKFNYHPGGQFLPLPSGQPSHFALDFRYVHGSTIRFGPSLRQLAAG